MEEKEGNVKGEYPKYLPLRSLLFYKRPIVVT